MRLTQQDVATIKSILTAILGTDLRIWLFGSRVDDSKAGGDTDLFVDTDKPTSLMDIVTCRLRLKEYFDMKIDLLVKRPGIEKPIYQIARETGIIL